MTRRKKPVDYINDLCSSNSRRKRKIGRKLKGLYTAWTETLEPLSFLRFLEYIRQTKEQIGAAQFFGKFRAYSFEEYVYRLLRRRVLVSEPLDVFWGRQVGVSVKNSEEVYGIEVDIAIGIIREAFVVPEVIVEAKVELDASRLKTALATFMLVKARYMKTRCFLVYVNQELNPALFNLSRKWVDGIFKFNTRGEDIAKFVKAVQKALERKR
jgi:hypothetical protein